MVIKSKKNLVWLCVFVAVVSWMVYYMHNKSCQEELDRINEIREARRLFNAQTMRAIGINAKIADGTEVLSHSEILQFCDLINRQHNIDVPLSDVAMYYEEGTVKLLLTSDRLYLLNKDSIVLYWELMQMEVSSIEWERTTNGDIFIGGQRYHFLVNCRKPFVDAIRKVIVNCKIYSEDKKGGNN